QTRSQIGEPLDCRPVDSEAEQYVAPRISRGTWFLPGFSQPGRTAKRLRRGCFAGTAGLKLLDTNVLIHCLKGKEPATSRMRAAEPMEVAISSVTAYELEYGTLKIADPRRHSALCRLLEHVREIPFD